MFEFYFHSVFYIDVSTACTLTGLKKSSLYSEVEKLDKDHAKEVIHDPGALYQFLMRYYGAEMQPPTEQVISDYGKFIWHAKKGSVQLPAELASRCSPFLVLLSCEDMQKLFDVKYSTIIHWIRKKEFPAQMRPGKRPAVWDFAEVYRALCIRGSLQDTPSDAEILEAKFQFLRSKFVEVEARINQNRKEKRAATGRRVMEQVKNILGGSSCQKKGDIILDVPTFISYS